MDTYPIDDEHNYSYQPYYGGPDPSRLAEVILAAEKQDKAALLRTDVLPEQRGTQTNRTRQEVLADLGSIVTRVA